MSFRLRSEIAIESPDERSNVDKNGVDSACTQTHVRLTSHHLADDSSNSYRNEYLDGFLIKHHFLSVD